MADNVVIIGAGHGGVEVAVQLRQRGFAGAVTLVDAAPHMPYQRPPLSKDFLNGEDASPLLLKAAALYGKIAITLKLGAAVIAIDRAARRVLVGGDAVPYDHLVLALGARNRTLPIPGADDPEVLELRDLDHSLAIRRVLAEEGGVAIVGAGFIGLELAAVLRGRNKDVDVIELAQRPLGRAVSEPVAAYVRAAHEAMGTRFHFGRTILRIRREGVDFVVDLDGGEEIRAARVVIAAGVVPNDALARAAGLATDGGIVVDAHLLTSDAAISAIGDCVAFPCVHAGVRVRRESVQNALDQARTVARRLTGEPAAYTDLPWFWSNQGSIRLQIAGVGTGHDSVVTRAYGPDRLTAFLYRGERLMAVETINTPGDHMAARKILERGGTVAAEVAADPGAELKTLVRQEGR